MRKFPVTIALCILAQTLFSQQDTLLQKFKFRTSHYRAMNYNMNGSSHFNQSEPGSGTHTNSSSSGALGAPYYAFKSTDRVLFTTSGSLYSSFYTGKADNPTPDNTNTRLYVMPGFNILNKWFAGSMYTELGASVTSGIQLNKDVGPNYPGPEKIKRPNTRSRSIPVLEKADWKTLPICKMPCG